MTDIDPDAPLFINSLIFQYFDTLVEAVGADSAPDIPVPDTVGNATGDSALIALTVAARRALENFPTQVQILRDEMRVTALTALAADRATWTHTTVEPAPDYSDGADE